MRRHLVIPDAHAHPDFSNERADWLSQLIIDSQPDVVIDMGDSADMPSLASYDKGKRSFHGRSYRKDIDSYLDFQERVWGPIKKRKKRMPWTIRLIGNHEQRIERALDLSPELVGTIGYKDLQLEDYYDEIVPYQGGTPGIINVDGIHYAHYFVSGVMGRPIAGEHPAYGLVTKGATSCTAGHLHTFDHSVRTTTDGRKIHGLVCGCYQDYDSPWAGNINRLWWRGIVIKDVYANGQYDIWTHSIESLRFMYGTK
jgi:hypothetical protein